MEVALAALRTVNARPGGRRASAAGGDRDQGQAAADGRALPLAGSDVLVVTDDNPRSRVRRSAIRAAAAGRRLARRRSAADRAARSATARAAVAEAVRLALGRARGAVLVAGKGHEHGQEVGGIGAWPFDDRDVLREALSVITRRHGDGPGSRAGDRTHPRRGGHGHRWPVDRRRRRRGPWSSGPVVADSRQAVPPAACSLALPGERVDGHDLRYSAAAAGAVAALVATRSVVQSVLVD